MTLSQWVDHYVVSKKVALSSLSSRITNMNTLV